MQTLIKRLIDFYNRSGPDTAESCMSQIWEGITRVYHKRLLDALKSGNEQQVAKELDEFVVSGGSHGMEYKPEVYSIPNLGLDRSLLTDEELHVPDFKTGTGAITLSGNVSLLIHKLTGGVPRNILEIGGGLGFVGVIMSRWGAVTYTDIDIPTNALAAAFFFSRCCGSHRVFLNGETKEQSDPNYYQFAHYYPASDFVAAKTAKRYDVIVNVNSFPEIPNSMQDQYVAFISECLSSGGMFLSINHENTALNQRSVPDAMKSSTGLVCVSRKPSFLAGYIEEVYRKSL